MGKILEHWYKRDDGRVTHLTEDGFLFVLTSIGDGWVWSVWDTNVGDEFKSVSPSNRAVSTTPRECIHEARQWYIEFLQQQKNNEMRRRIVKFD